LKNKKDKIELKISDMIDLDVFLVNKILNNGK
jgi:hypothetical protein